MNIVAGIASLPERVNSLERTLDSLTGQVDHIVCVLNGHTDMPPYHKKYDNVWFIKSDNMRGASMKLYTAQHVKGYYFSTDDDICYPKTYIRDMIAKIDQYKCIVTLHGKRYDGERPVKSYRRDFTTNIHCLQAWNTDTIVDVGGTGVMGFHTDFFNVPMYELTEPNMVDVMVGKVASEKGVKIMALAHSATYLRYLKPPSGTTLWERYRGDDSKQTAILNSFLK